VSPLTDRHTAAVDPPDARDTAGTIVTAEAVIQTPNAARYLARLCRHASQMGGHGSQVSQHLRHRPRVAAAGYGEAPPEVQHAEWSKTDGTVTLNWGRWTLHTDDGTLTIRAEAASRENLRQIQDLLTTRLENFGKREHLTVTWQQPRTASSG
jgi:hypothetical protein